MVETSQARRYIDGIQKTIRTSPSSEREVLYPLAERVIPDTMRDDIITGYAAAEARTTANFSAKYEAVVVGYEQE